MRNGRMLARASPDKVERICWFEEAAPDEGSGSRGKMAKLVGKALRCGIEGDILFVDVSDTSKMMEVLDQVKPLDFKVIETYAGSAFLKLAI